MVVDPIHVVGIGEGEEVEAGAEIDTTGKRGGDFDARAEGAGSEADRLGAERPQHLEDVWCALSGNWANKCAFGWGLSGCWCYLEGEFAGLGKVDRC